MVLQRESGSGIRKACDEFLQLKRVHLGQTMQLGSTEALVQGAIAGLGVALMPVLLIGPELAQRSLVPACRAPSRSSSSVTDFSPDDR